MLGCVTIGQAPRDDIVSSMLPWATRGVVQAGALDELTMDEIRALHPTPDEHPLVSRVRSGEQVRLSKARLIPYLQAAVDRVEVAGATVTCILCTGAFPGLTAHGRLMYPDQLLRAVVDVLLPSGTLGVLMPDVGQAEMMHAKWEKEDREILLATASPYVDGESTFATAADAVLYGRAALIVMDCMGYTREMQGWVVARSRVPVMLSNGLVGGVLRESGALVGTFDEL